MSVRPLRPDTDRCLGEPLPHQLANRTRAPLQAPGLAVPGFGFQAFKPRTSCGISVPFGTLSPTRRQVTHVLLTRLPLSFSLAGKTAFDLHVLGTPPALILSQDQTLMLNSLSSALRLKRNCLTRGRLALRCFNPFVYKVVHRQSPSHGLTTPVDR